MAGQMDYHPASSRKEILTHTATWMNLEDRLLNGLSQRQKDEYGRVPPNVRYPEWSKPESRIVVAEGEEAGGRELLRNGRRVSVWAGEEVLETAGWW